MGLSWTVGPLVPSRLLTHAPKPQPPTGVYSTCANTKKDGTIFCWGDGYGQDYPQVPLSQNPNLQAGVADAQSKVPMKNYLPPNPYDLRGPMVMSQYGRVICYYK